MNFQTHNDKSINTGGSSLVGEINVSFAKLTEKFGKPTGSDGYKSDAKWEVEFENGVVATIYNWKNGKNYCGSSGIPRTKITNWHVGGFKQEALDLVEAAIQ